MVVFLGPGGLVISAAIVLAQAAPVPTAPTPEAIAAHQQVSVTIGGSAAEAARLSVALTDATRRLGVGVDLRRDASTFAPGDAANLALLPPAPNAPPLTARLWIDLSERDRVTLYVADDQRDRVFIRRFDTPSGLDEVALEQLVLAASSSIEAILAGHLIGVARRDYEASLRVEKPTLLIPVPTTESPSRSSGSLSWTYGATWLGPGAIAHGPGLGVRLERPRWGIGLWGQARLPVEVGPDGNDSLKVSLTTFGFRYRAWLALPISPTLSLQPGLGIGADFTRVSSRTDAPDDVVAAGRYWAADALLHGGLGLHYRSRSWSLTAAVGADVSVQPVRYVLDRASSLSDVFVPFRARPFLELAFAAVLLP